MSTLDHVYEFVEHNVSHLQPLKKLVIIKKTLFGVLFFDDLLESLKKGGVRFVVKRIWPTHTLQRK